MKKTLISSALEANLTQTKNVDNSIPEEHLWLISLTKNYWGINNRMYDFFTEFHHPYSNRKEVIDNLVSVSITDFWVFKHSESRERVVHILLDIFDNLLKEKLTDDLSKNLIYIFLDFFNKNFDIFSEYKNLIFKFIDILDKNFDNNQFAYISNIGSFKKYLNIADKCDGTEGIVVGLMKRIINYNINYWEKTTEIEKWYVDNKTKMSLDYYDSIKTLGKDFYFKQYEEVKKTNSWSFVNNSYTFTDIIDAYKNQINIFKKETEKLYYLFYLIQLSGVVYHRDFLLIEINNSLKKIGSELNEEQCIQSVDELFIIFTSLKKSHINYILDAILTLGKEIINTKNNNLIQSYVNQVINFGFVSPNVAYLTEDWELKIDSNHVKNIRVWLELIEYNPELMKKLLSALIINIRVGGIFIFDSDLFQKDVTNLLNSKISPVYKQIKQLLRIFPVYFNEIGAEGQLRDVSTEIDELSHRNDKLIHFLRKQIHTEGNNSHIDITFEVINFWYDLDKNRLLNILPKNVFESVDIKGVWVTGVHDVLLKASKLCNDNVAELIDKSNENLDKIFDSINHNNKFDIQRVRLIIKLYQLLKEKYLFETNNIFKILEKYDFIGKQDIQQLKKCIHKDDNIEALKIIYSLMVKLNGIIFNSQKSEGWENIYYKRHIAVGIPSMYGQYRETKFEAMGLTFRLERVASIIVGKIISSINTDYFTAKSLKDIYSVIQLLWEGLRLDGIYNQGLDSNLKMFQYSLISGSFNIRQYINIFQFMEVSIKEIINKYFINPYEQIINQIVPQYLNEKDIFNNDNLKKEILQKSEVFYRELLSSAFLIQQLDNFIGELHNNSRKLITKLNDNEIQNIMSYNPELVISPLYLETPSIDNQVFLGSKGYYLKKLSLNNYPVPPGFVITTEIFRRYHSILKIDSLNAEIDCLIMQQISELEKKTGLFYGDTKKPLLLSVRSGAAISMPGVMNTFLNIGLNDEITECLSKQYNFGWTSWDCYRRLLQTWGMANGLSRNDFDQIILNYKERYNVARKVDFTPEIMKEIAFAYKKYLEENNVFFELDPIKQLKKAILSVFHSWNTPRAITYRKHLQIAEEWGTAVIVQQMVFGNLHYESGSGVLFTHDLKDNISSININGDFSFLSQGEDIVAGLVNTLPLSETQRLKYYHKSPFSLETAFPKIYTKLRDISQELIETHGFSHQEIEFTFETSEPKDLYILQTRNMLLYKNTKLEIFAVPEANMTQVGCGIGIGNKVLNGVIVFDIDDVVELKQNDPQKKAVLVRPDTVPDDIEIIFECDGLLTAKGGATSHAAVTAASLGMTCVVNCDDLIVYEKEKKCIIGDTIFLLHDPVAIDGNKGIVYKGNYPVKIQDL